MKNEANRKSRTIVVICGPTAVGKTKFAIRVAEDTGGEIVSCDSMQLYQYLDIGSAKPTPEEQARAKHYLVGEIDPRVPFSAAEYRTRARAAIEHIFSLGKLPIVAGGTGLYLNSLLFDMDFSAPPRDDGFRDELCQIAEEKGPEYLHNLLSAQDPAAAARIHPNNIRKVVRALEILKSGSPLKDISRDPQRTKDYRVILTGLTRQRQELYDRIDRRVDLLTEAGLENEVRSLLNMGLTLDDISMKGIGYKEIIGYLNGEYPWEEAVRLIKRNTRRFAKRQMTWFRRYKEMKWFNISAYASADECLQALERYIRSELNNAELSEYETKENGIEV